MMILSCLIIKARILQNIKSFLQKALLKKEFELTGLKMVDKVYIYGAKVEGVIVKMF